MSRNEVGVLSSAAPWPQRDESLTVTVERGQGPVTDSSDSLDKWNPGLLERQTARAEDCNRRIVEYDKAIAEAKRLVEHNEDLKRQEQVHLANALVIIAKQRALRPVLKPVDPTAQQRLFATIAALYHESASTGRDVKFSILPELLDANANNITEVSNRTTGEGSRNHSIGVFGRGTLYGDYTVKDVVAKARTMSGSTFNVLRNELGV